MEANTVLNEAEKKSLNEKAVLIYLNIQKEKEEFEDTVEEEYIEKVIMFGYLVVRLAKSLLHAQKQSFFLISTVSSR